MKIIGRKKQLVAISIQAYNADKVQCINAAPSMQKKRFRFQVSRDVSAEPFIILKKLPRGQEFVSPSEKVKIDGRKVAKLLQRNQVILKICRTIRSFQNSDS